MTYNIEPTECEVTLQLDKGDQWSDTEGWTDNQNGAYSQTVSVTTTSSLSLPILKKEGYIFGGWQTSTPQQSYVAYKTGTETNPKVECKMDVSSLGGQTVTLNPIWYCYAIDITQAKYVLPIGQESTNRTVNLTHINSMSDYVKLGDSEKQEYILNFLNQNANTLILDYTISYTDNDGNPQTLDRENVSLKIDWGSDWTEIVAGWGDGITPTSHADFRNLFKNLENITGTSPWIRLSDSYLKDLIVKAEKQTNQDLSLTVDNTTFSDWGYYSVNNKFYENGDADTTCLKVQIGNSNNKTTDISGNENYMIETVSPSNVKLDLFDYWLVDQYYYDQHPDNPNSLLVTSGVNENHALLFRIGNMQGSWNTWTGSIGGATQGIVENKLVDGYPKLNIDEQFKATGEWTYDGKKYTYYRDESLAYLFDVATVNASTYGKGYSGVKGLFKINEDGNYYYSSHDNFAEYDSDDKSFNVYNTWGVKKAGSSPNGQFYPFNSANEVFSISNGSITQKNFTAKDNLINHYLGLTMEVDFQQPIDGMVSVGANGKPMVFDFSGDDDVWIFIDGVLVADLGGIHDELSVSIDFSTGDVVIQRASNPNTSTTIRTTIKEQFEKAGVSTANFNGNTFGNNTTHTLKMFYMERGNTDSNLTLSFNLMEPVENEIIKLDQNGLPVQDASFDLYVAKKDDNGSPILNTDGSYEVEGTAIVTGMTTDADGHVNLSGEYDYSLHDYYVLKETAPEGYFSPGDILLRYDRYEKHPDGTSSGTNLLMVENRWTTGALANFTANVYQSGTLKYDNTEYGTIDLDTGKNGLIVAVPLLKGSDGNWYPLYGSNIVGFNSVDHDNTTLGQRKAVLRAALYQIYSSQYPAVDADYAFSQWYLEWDENNSRYQGILRDLPGDASRYYWASGVADSDLTMVYYFLDLEKLELTGYNEEMTTEEKYKLIYNAIDPNASHDITEEEVIKNTNELVDKIMNLNNDGDSTNSSPTFALLDVGDFNRVFSSRIYVPNIQPQLNVQKLDQDGNPIANVEFTLYSDEKCTELFASGVTNENGILTFSHTAENPAGTAKVKFKGNTYYWLKETKDVEGYKMNEEVVPVYVTSNGRIYADALEANDGITVKKGLGKLLQTMVKYAGNGDINATLRDITAKLFTVKDFDAIADAIDDGKVSGETLNLHYGLSTAIMEYGTHEINGVAPNPYFEVDEGIAGIIVNQNYSAHEGDSLYSTVAVKNDLQDTNIRGLFTGSTTVVVRNRKENSDGTFSIQKTVSGSDIVDDASFNFSVKITQPDTTSTVELNDSYTYNVYEEGNTNPVETGSLKFAKNSTGEWTISQVKTTNSTYVVSDTNGVYQICLKANDKIVVEGLPFGLSVQVEELNSVGYITSVSVNNGSWAVKDGASGIIEKPIGNPAFVFNNHKDKVTDLTVKKLLSEGDTSTTAFPFEITLRDKTGAALLTGNYQWKVFDDAGEQIVDNNRTLSGTITDGKLIVNLKTNEKVVIEDIPVESTYIIRETTLGYKPAVTVNGVDQPVVDGAISGSLNAQDQDGDYIPTDVEYTNTRSGSITLTKKDGQGNILSGAGFTLYSVGDAGNKTKVGNEQFTQLVVRTEIGNSDSNFDKDSMRYNVGTESYIVHNINGKNCYYRWLTEAEKQAYYNGTFADKDKVEAVVEFDELPLGQYCIEETTVPDGYTQNAALEQTLSGIVLPMTVGEGNTTDVYYDILYTVTNHAKLVLPTTGIDGIHNGLTLAIGIMFVAIIGWTQRKRIYRLFSK